MAHGFLIAAPHSGSGKTTITLGLLRALRNKGVALGPAKAGPDFIDPAFHTAASGSACVNLDPWAMRHGLIQDLAARQAEKGLLVVEAMMGLFDGAADGSGAASDVAVALNLPVVLVVDAARQSHSIAALVRGFRDHRTDVSIAGVVLNRVGSLRHETMLREALAGISVPVLGVVGRDEKLALPSRHLGLVQAKEIDALETFIDHAAAAVGDQLDLDRLTSLELASIKPGGVCTLRPPGQRIAVARDIAFAFSYPHLLCGWQEQGASLSFFSPLDNEAPDSDADAVFLPGGYPELHAQQLAANRIFLDGLRRAATSGAFVYGECGGYMVLGEKLIDAEGQHHKMANLLPLVTSFETRNLHLGYRLAKPLSSLPFADESEPVFTVHEFHYSTAVREGNVDPLFKVEDARGQDLGLSGMRVGGVAGSYMHLIDRRIAE